MEYLTKLNLGCGKNMMPGFVNVDKNGSPDVVHDLEVFPWPWEDSRFDEVVLSHVLEHLGETTDVFLGVMKELYRVSAPNAVIRIAVPHPRSDDFINDPTHCRAITAEMMSLFSKEQNRLWIDGGFSNSPLALHIDVDFKLTSIDLELDEPWRSQFSAKQVSQDDLAIAMRRYNNVVREIRMTLQVVKAG